MSHRSNAAWLVCAALLATAAAGGCAKDDAGVLFDLQAPSAPQERPDTLHFHWLAPGGVLLQGQLPSAGSLPADGDMLATLFIATSGPLSEARVLAVRGLRGEQVVAGGVLRLEPTGESRPSRQLRLEGPLADSDGDGVPDVVQLNCLTSTSIGCTPDAGPSTNPPDAGHGGDGGPSLDAPDAGAGTDTVPSPPPDATTPDVRADAGPADARDAARDLPLPPSDAPREAGGSALATGLVAHWRFDDGAGSTTVRDSSGNGNTGTLIGISPATGWMAEGHIGGALEIPGADGNGVLVPPTGSVETISGAFTIAAWTWRSTNRSSGLSNVLSRRSATEINAEYFALAFSSNGQARGFINTQTSSTGLVVSTNVPLDQWVHVAVTYDSTAMRIYVGGAQTGTSNYKQPVVSGSKPLCLGCANNRSSDTDTDETLGGRLDELLLYNRALTADEIRALAAGELPPSL